MFFAITPPNLAGGKIVETYKIFNINICTPYKFVIFRKNRLQVLVEYPLIYSINCMGKLL